MKNYHARLVINDASELSKAEVKRMADWFRQQAKSLKREHKNYSKRYTAKLLK